MMSWIRILVTTPKTVTDVYVAARMLDGTREGAVGVCFMILCVIFGGMGSWFFGMLWFIAKQPFVIAWKILMGICGCKRRSGARLTEGTYQDHRQSMKELRILHSYQFGKNPTYRKAFIAIKSQNEAIFERRNTDSAGSVGGLSKVVPN